MWEKLSMVNDEDVIKLMMAKVYVFSDSVLCVGKVGGHPQSNIDWENMLEWFKITTQYRELHGIDGVPLEFEWMIFPGHTTLEIVQVVQELMRRLSCEPEKFQGRIIFMSMYNEIEWGSEKNERVCLANAAIMGCPKRFAKEWSATDIFKPGGRRDKVADLMMGAPVKVVKRIWSSSHRFRENLRMYKTI